MRNLAKFPVTDCEVLQAAERAVEDFQEKIRQPNAPVGGIQGPALQRIHEIIRKLDRTPSEVGNGSLLEEMLLDLHQKEFGNG